MNTMRKQTGFTLIELMIVIAILGILLAIAIPAYQDYSNRARASEGLNMASAPKLAVSETFISEGTLPATNSAAGYSFAGATTLVSDITIGTPNAGDVQITTQNTGCDTDPIFVLTPDTSVSTGVQWSCTASQGQECAPASCRD
jgi:prepilin-type N-terminal cleavage/methylation domain-containing protein